MKKNVISLIGILVVISLTACSNKPKVSEGTVQDVQTDTVYDIEQISEEAEETESEEMESEETESEETGSDENGSDGKDDTAYNVLDHLVGEYDYTSEDGSGKLTIQKTVDAYDASAADKKIVDYETLDIKEYEYPLEFSMGDNLKTAIAQLALTYVSFNGDTPRTGGFKEFFIAEFIQNSRMSFDYLDLISDQNNGQISIDELNYIQYSLTNTELDFSTLVSGSIDRYEAASPLCSASITGYDHKDTNNGVLITADLEVRYDGTEDTQKYEVTAELVRNPYSCFDGYSITALSSTMLDNLILR